LQGSTLTASPGTSTTLVTNSFVTTGVTTAIGGVTGNISLGTGLAIAGGTLSVTTTETTINSLLGVLTLQGTANQVGVSSAGNTITFSTPQDIATSSSPTFQTLTLTTAGTQGGNTICDSSNNCGFSTVSGAYVQGGNSFGATAFIGTTDTYDLVFKTDNISRVTIDSVGDAIFTGNLAVSKTLSVTQSLAVNKGAAVQTGAATSTGLVVKGAGSQTADLVQLQNSSNQVLSGFDANGQLYLGRASGLTGSSKFYNAAGSGSITLQANNPGSSSFTLSLPSENGTLCSTGSVCTGYAPSTGGTGYIQNSTSLQTTANFNIQSVTASSKGGIIRAAVGQTANLFEAQDASGVGGFIIGSDGTQAAVGNLANPGNNISDFYGNIVPAGYVHPTFAVQQQLTDPAAGFYIGNSSELRVNYLAPGPDNNIYAGSISAIETAPTSGYVANSFIAGANVVNIQNISGVGTVTSGADVLYVSDNIPVGNVTIHGISSRLGNGAVADTYYGMLITSPSGGGTINDEYGLYIDDHSTGTNTSYNLYSVGSATKNIFEGSVGVGNAVAPNKLSINVLTTADPDAQLAVGTDSATSKGIVVQAVASQSANLQEWQSSTGTVLASIGASGDLAVVNATVNGTLTVNGNSTFNGHIITGNSSGSTTVAAGAGAGAGATASVTGNDTSGKITITTGTGSASGLLGTVTFAQSFGTAPNIMLTPANGNGSSIQYFVGSSNTTSFTINANNAPADSTTYTYYYHVMQ
jgi:hypothetical protein